AGAQPVFGGAVAVNRPAPSSQPSPSQSGLSGQGSQASPTPSPSRSCWLGVKSEGELSSVSARASRARAVGLVGGVEGERAVVVDVDTAVARRRGVPRPAGGRAGVSVCWRAGKG